MFSSIKDIFKSSSEILVTYNEIQSDRESYKQLYEKLNNKPFQLYLPLKYFNTIDGYEYRVLVCYLYDKEINCINDTKPVYMKESDFVYLIQQICPYSFTITIKNKHSITINQLFIR